MIAALLSLTASADSFIGENAGVTIHQSTPLFVDSWAGGERMVWWGDGTLTVTAPDSTVSYVDPGQDLNLTQIGQWALALSADQDEDFSVAVLDADGNQQHGRLSSTAWILSVDAGGWLEQYFFVPAPQHEEPGVGPDEWEGRMLKARLEGLYGEYMVVMANRQGTDDHPLQSVPAALSDAQGELPLYLNFPERIEPTASATDAGELKLEWSSAQCELVSPGISSVELTLETEARGQVVFTCSQDDVFDHSAADGDVVAAVGSGPGTTGWMFSGQDTLEQGDTAPGDYTCVAQVLESPLHLLVGGADLASPGVRLYETVGVGSYESQAMFWNDQRLDDGTTSTASGAAGVLSGAYEDAGAPDVNAHGWGSAPEASSRGTDAWIDTWSALAVISSETVQVTVVDPAADQDLDGLPDAEEACLYGTAADDADTDGDGVEDGAEVEAGTDPLDPDDPGTPDKAGGDEAEVGNLAGGACGCAAAPAAQGAWLAVALAVVGWRRREQ